MLVDRAHLEDSAQLAAACMGCHDTRYTRGGTPEAVHPRRHMSGIIADGTSGIVNTVLSRALETVEKKILGKGNPRRHTRGGIIYPRGHRRVRARCASVVMSLASLIQAEPGCAVIRVPEVACNS
eukprot:scaffold21229_cov63-Phaeocystis_antarctica.AAC.2